MSFNTNFRIVLFRLKPLKKSLFLLKCMTILICSFKIYGYNVWLFQEVVGRVAGLTETKINIDLRTFLYSKSLSLLECITNLICYLKFVVYCCCLLLSIVYCRLLLLFTIVVYYCCLLLLLSTIVVVYYCCCLLLLL